MVREHGGDGALLGPACGDVGGLSVAELSRQGGFVGVAGLDVGGDGGGHGLELGIGEWASNVVGEFPIAWLSAGVGDDAEHSAGEFGLRGFVGGDGDVFPSDAGGFVLPAKVG